MFGANKPELQNLYMPVTDEQSQRNYEDYEELKTKYFR
jgi:hypothetical protein